MFVLNLKYDPHTHTIQDAITFSRNHFVQLDWGWIGLRITTMRGLIGLIVHSRLNIWNMAILKQYVENVQYIKILYSSDVSRFDHFVIFVLVSFFFLFIEVESRR